MVMVWSYSSQDLTGSLYFLGSGFARKRQTLLAITYKYVHIYKQLFKKINYGPADVAQGLGALIVFVEDPGSNPSIQKAAHKCL